MKMKIAPFILVALLMACSSPSDLNPKENQSGFDVPQGVFDGTWLLLETKGFDLSGSSYVKDSVSEGYSVRFEFYDSNGQTGKLKTFKNSSEDVDYIYEFTLSEEQVTRRIELDRMTNALPEEYYWEITFIGEETHLFLRNRDYFNDECCPEKIEHHFLLVGRNHT